MARHPLTLTLGRPLLALAIAVLVGLVVSRLLQGALASEGETEVSTLLAALFAAGMETTRLLLVLVVVPMVALVVTLLVWAIGLAVAARRLYPPRRRSAPVLLTVGLALLGSVVLLVAGGAVRGSGATAPRPLDLWADPLGVAVLVVCAASCVVFPWWERRLQVERAEGRTPQDPDAGAVEPDLPWARD